ncbi:unnamed protein product [Caenorhabditis auriculariae]|uniref:3-hydroxyacyl-CoA dehydrogenase n=1 Tax=Caenorhabditis auriculariae TaxID=2777116 RepID=A0A8S1HNU9_9PELO|nr:unnamed protein product [Caenorhabditis auriculariae]
MTENKKIAIVGSGLIGSSWASLFLSGGYKVVLYDVGEAQLQTSLKHVHDNLVKLDEKGLQRGVLTAEEAFRNVSTTTDLAEALRDAFYVQESTIETVEFHVKIFAEMDALAAPETILASSTSTIPASQFTEHLKNRERCLVVHPVNPPLFLPLTELVPAPWTSESTLHTATTLMTSIGQEPIRLNREVLGFGVNRLQFAIMAEAWRLVADDVLSPEDVDKIMSAGLGPRYAFNGPWATTHLNAFGIRDYWKRYGPGARRVLADFGPTPSFEEEHVIEKLERSLNASMPLDSLKTFMANREESLAKIAKLKKE